MRAAVLDFDGVIVASMALHAEAYRRVLAPFGVPVGDDDVYWLEGARSEQVIEGLLERSPRRLDSATVQRLANEKQGVYRALGPPPLYPGANAMVAAVRAAAPRLGLVTGSRRDNLEAVVPELLPEFDVILAAKDYTHGKPHPEPFAKAAQRLNVAPARCVALENAPRGIQSALAADYGHVVGLATTLPVSALQDAGAPVVVQNHADAAAAVTRWLRGS